MAKSKIKIEEIESVSDESLSPTELWEKWLNFLDMSMKFQIQKNEKRNNRKLPNRNFGKRMAKQPTSIF